MKSILLGQLRINLEHLVWYTPVGQPGAAPPGDVPALSLKTIDAPQAIAIHYRSFEARDRDVHTLDRLFGTHGGGQDVR